MSNKYAQGNYIITLFDFHGTKVRSTPATVHSYLESRQEGLELMDDDDNVESYTVARVLFNSKVRSKQ